MSKKRTRSKGKSSRKAYSGFIKFPLAGADDKHDFHSSCEFYGDFADVNRRYQILSKPRNFQVEVHLKVVDKQEYSVAQVNLPDRKVGLNQLSRILYHAATNEVKALFEEGEDFELNESYFKVII